MTGEDKFFETLSKAVDYIDNLTKKPVDYDAILKWYKSMGYKNDIEVLSMKIPMEALDDKL